LNSLTLSSKKAKNEFIVENVDIGEDLKINNKSNQTTGRSGKKALEVTTCLSIEIGRKFEVTKENLVFNSINNNSSSTKNSFSNIPKLIFPDKQEKPKEITSLRPKEFKDDYEEDYKSPDKHKEIKSGMYILYYFINLLKINN